MKMMAVTVMKLLMMVVTLVAVKPVQIVNMIGQITALNAVIQPGMHLVLTVPH